MSNKPLTPFAANPFVFIFSALVLMAVLVYFGWGALDRTGLADEEAGAVVTGKRYYPPGTTSRTNIVAGRAWTQTDATSDAYVLELKVGQEPTAAAVSRESYDSLQAGDSVRVRVHRTRLTRRLEVADVMR
jgi:hypothetical protein